MRVGRRVGVQAVKRRGVQVVQSGAAVDQQGLAEHPRDAVLGAEHAAITPLIEHRAGLAHRGSSTASAPRHEAGQVQPVEFAQLLEGVEAGE